MIHALALDEVPLAVIDIETTGLSVHSDRVIEVSVVRIEPGESPKLVFDTLIDPQRRVTGSRIHGITGDHVAGAPLFGDIVDELEAATAGALVATFNASFDMPFLQSEARYVRRSFIAPYACLMWMRRVVGLGDRTTLAKACSACGIILTDAHRAARDALAAAELWPHYIAAARTHGVRTFADLADRASHGYMKSWETPFGDGPAMPSKRTVALKSRSVMPKPPQPDADRARQNAIALYWGAIRSALSDDRIGDEEMRALKEVQRECGIDSGSLRFVHARVLAGLLDTISRDGDVDDAEVQRVQHLSERLGELGWAPGFDHA